MADYATLLRDHTTLTCRSVDRFFLQGYVPKLQSVGQVCRFLRWQRRFPIPSSAAFGKIGDGYVQGRPSLRRGQRHPGGAFQEGREQGGRGPPADRRGRGRGGRREGGADRDRPGEGVGVAVVAGQGPGETLAIRTWSGAGRWPSSTTSTSTSGTRSGVRRSSRPTPTPPGRSGST